MVPKGTANIKQSPTLTQININPNIEGLFISVSITWFTSGFQEKLLGDKKSKWKQSEETNETWTPVSDIMKIFKLSARE